MNKKNKLCPCGSRQLYSACCGRYLENNEWPHNAEALMRSRYTAYTLLREDYLLATWHPTTRPGALHLEEGSTRWLGLEVKRHEQQDATHAVVEFIARYRSQGRTQQLHEISRFIFENGRWFYVDGTQL